MIPLRWKEEDRRSEERKREGGGQSVGIHRDTQTDRHRDRQADRETDSETGRQAGRENAITSRFKDFISFDSFRAERVTER